MRPLNLWTQTDAAEVFGTDLSTIIGLVKALGIETKPTGLPGRAKGLDARDMARIARSLEREFDPKALAATA